MLNNKTILIILLIAIVGMAGCELDLASDVPEVNGVSPVISKACSISAKWNDRGGRYYWPHMVNQVPHQIPYPEPGYVVKYFSYSVANPCGISVYAEVYERGSNAFYILHNRSNQYVRLMLREPVIRKRLRYLAIRLRTSSGIIIADPAAMLAIYIC